MSLYKKIKRAIRKKKRYRGSDVDVIIPDGVKKIGKRMFSGRADIISVTIPDSVREIGEYAFSGCESLTSLTIPDSVKKIGKNAFNECESLSSIVIPDGVREIGEYAFSGCKSLASVIIPGSVKKMGEHAFSGCDGLTSITIPNGVMKIGKYSFDDCVHLTSITIADGVKKIEKDAFRSRTSLISVTIPDSVSIIGKYAFFGCDSLSSITIPNGVMKIGEHAFSRCKSLTSLTIPDSVTKIGKSAFYGCTGLTSIEIPDNVTKIADHAFLNCPRLSVICRENSYAHRFCAGNNISFLFDYQFESFRGTTPQTTKKLESPFLADEEKPYIFISYSHKDRETVLPILKDLYESGWKVWYDEGLTIGDKYDEVLEYHVRNCSAFLLFVTGNSLVSRYIDEHEIPWARRFGKPIVKCILETGEDYDISDANVVASVSPDRIGSALDRTGGLTKGEKREAKGITVTVDPSLRIENYDSDGFAYCIYSGRASSDAKTIIRTVKDGGGIVYDAVEEGEDEKKLSGCRCLVVFLDNEFLSDAHLSGILEEKLKAGKDVAVCQLENVTLPFALEELDQKHWLKYTRGISDDLNKNLLRHLERRGCRDTSVIPGFKYEKTDGGIVITKYVANDPHPRLESEYGGIPVVEIGASAFENCNFITEFKIPDGVTKIGDSAFSGCTNLGSVTIPAGMTKIGDCAFGGCPGLSSITLPDSLTEIGEGAFYDCKRLSSIKIPDRVTKIGDSVFSGCTNLGSVTIPAGVTKIGNYAFGGCPGLSSITLPDSLTEIGEEAFYDCKRLSSIKIPDRVTKIGNAAFEGCKSLTSIKIPDGVARIEDFSFSGCAALASVTIPDGVTRIGDYAFDECAELSLISIPDSVKKISKSAFFDCDKLTVACHRGSYAEKYCKKEKIRVRYVTGFPGDQSETMKKIMSYWKKS